LLNFTDGSDSLADTAKGERKADWQKRKEAYLEHLDTADHDVLRVSLADKVHNARSILRDLRKPDVGEAIWSRFSQPREKTLWYRSLADKFCERWPSQLADDLREIVEVLEDTSSSTIGDNNPTDMRWRHRKKPHAMTTPRAGKSTPTCD
jgi:hypothetical protein